MLPFSVTQYVQRFEALLPQVRAEANACALPFQHVYTSYLVVRAAGMIELALREVLGEYASRRGSAELRSFISNTVARENSINCEKLQRVLDRFDSAWWADIYAMTSAPQRTAIDSLKTLRDQFAHGQPNGTGFAIAEGYYNLAKPFLQVVSDRINP